MSELTQPTDKTLCRHCAEQYKDHLAGRCLWGPTTFDHYACVYCFGPIEDPVRTFMTVQFEGDLYYFAHRLCIEPRLRELRTIRPFVDYDVLKQVAVKELLAQREKEQESKP